MDEGASDVLDTNAGDGKTDCVTTAHGRPSGVEFKADGDSQKENVTSKSPTPPGGASATDVLGKITALIKQVSVYLSVSTVFSFLFSVY